jgi:hypothetical protein
MVTITKVKDVRGSAQYPEYPVENGPPFFPWSTTAVFPPRRLGYQWI